MLGQRISNEGPYDIVCMLHPKYSRQHVKFKIRLCMQFRSGANGEEDSKKARRCNSRRGSKRPSLTGQIMYSADGSVGCQSTKENPFLLTPYRPARMLEAHVGTATVCRYC